MLEDFLRKSGMKLNILYFGNEIKFNSRFRRGDKDMKKKGQIGVGSIIVVAVLLIVGLILFQTVAQQVGTVYTPYPL